jgi:hypothetical protein
MYDFIPDTVLHFDLKGKTDEVRKEFSILLGFVRRHTRKGDWADPWHIFHRLSIG